ncbi:RNA-directed DNA polymerase, eukaryota [Tanacetum coccineum]
MNRSLFTRIVRDLSANCPYFQEGRDAVRKAGISALVKCTSAIRQLAYAAVPDSLDEYLQIGEKSSRDCLMHFCNGVIELYGEDSYLIVKHRLYKMTWAQCPQAYRAQFSRGDSGSEPFILLEAVASQDLWIWHAFFGVAGSNNDVNVLRQSPVLNDLKVGKAPRVLFVMGINNRFSYNSKEDQAQKISKSVFVTNFPDHFTARDLWNVCMAYGNVIDVFIPFKKSKAGKRFAFVRFIRVVNLDRLIENLCTIWIGRLCLHANTVKYQREPRSNFSQPKKLYEGSDKNTFLVVLKTGTVNPSLSTTSSPAIVLDDACLIERDFTCSLMGKIKDINAIANLYSILSNEGLPIKALTRNSFVKIVSKWGELTDVEDTENSSLSFKRLCVKAKSNVIIDGMIKIIVKGQVHWIRVKEIEAWSPKFIEEENSDSEEEESEGEEEEHFSETKVNDLNHDKDNDLDHVSESSCMRDFNQVYDKVSNVSEQPKQSDDPFRFYKILKRNKETTEAESEGPKFPHGFTLEVVEENVVNNELEKNSQPKSDMPVNNEGVTTDKSESNCVPKFRAGGSILEVMDEVIKMNFLSLNIQGLGHKAKKGWIQELNNKYRINFVAIQETKMERIDLFSIKALWGNLSFDYAFSPSVGSSGGIVSQDMSERRMLWDYFRHLIDTWDGECVLLGYFNEKKFQALKSSIKQWSYEEKQHSNATKLATQNCLSDLDKIIDQGRGNVDLVNERYKLSKELQDLNSSSSLDMDQKAKIRWSIEGDENSKYLHGIINKKRSQLTIRGVLAQGEWIDDPSNVKHEFFSHFASRFSAPSSHRIILDHQFPIRLSMDQNDDLERTITYEEIKRAIWDCGINKSPGPDGFTFEFFRRYWNVIDIDVVAAVLQFFSSSKFPRGCNASFITLIPKMQDAKVVKDFRPISLIDSPFILNELISWCKHKKIKAMIFRVDFEKAFDLVRWDYLDDVLNKFGFGVKWRGWIQGCLNSAMGSILVNDIDVNESLTLSHLFYADDDVFVGKWDNSNLSSIVNVLKCFFLASGLKINLHKSKLMGIGIVQDVVNMAANQIGCLTLSAPFTYLGVKVGGIMSRITSWDEVHAKVSSRLSKWKLKTLSIGGRFTLIKSFLSPLPLYQMSIYKVPMGVLHKLELIRRNFFNGTEKLDRGLSLISWKKILASKKMEGSKCLVTLLLIGHFSLNGFGVSFPLFLLYGRDFNALSRKGFDLLSHMKKKVGNGDNTSLWNDVWIAEVPLKLLYPRLYALVLDRHSSVAIWMLESSGDYSVKLTRSFIDDLLLPTVGVPTRWVNIVPIKINIFAWRVCLDKLPTRLHLSLCGIDIPSIICPNCSIAVESTSHLLFSCHLARQIMLKVARWWDLEVHDFHLYGDWLIWFNNLRLPKRLKEVLEGVFYVMWWTIWKF